jgi:uncharacterized protein (DUF2164 family)
LLYNCGSGVTVARFLAKEKVAGSNPVSRSKMTKSKKNKFDFVSEEERSKYIKEIIGFFQDERNEEIGFIAAEKVLDFFVGTMGDEIYKKAIGDASKLLKERIDDLEVELDILSIK